jgi:RHH-type proline utilization regulon transcriptional repressor/proline dehydrogenase/delta 1-pyrroline-5-carboxylate dehydrogenase
MNDIAVRHDRSLQARVRDIGLEIFEYAEESRPRIWQKAWWQERMTGLLDRDEALRTRAFQFVDCLPTLRTNESLLRHLAEYFDARRFRLPPVVHAVLGPGALRRWREDFVGTLARYGALQMAGRFITGYDVPSAIRTIERLRSQGMAFTLDVLGESTTSYRRADAYAAVYAELIDRLTRIAADWPTVSQVDNDRSGPAPRVNLSIKLTGLDPHFAAIDPERSIREAGGRLRPLLRRARDRGAFLTVDMESYKHRDLTIELFTRLLLEEEFRDWPHVGLVVQAYLKDGEADLGRLLEWREKRGTSFGIRLVKGAYWDAETATAVRNYADPPVWTRKWQTDACYERMTQTLLANAERVRPAFASHNVRSLAFALGLAERMQIPKSAYEVQMLYGMGDPLKSAMVRMGQCLRVYSPYGDLMPGMGYLIRRLLENSSNEGFLRQSFGLRAAHDRMLADPALAKPPSAPLPARRYQNSDAEEPMGTFRNATSTNFASAENRRKMHGAIQYVHGESGRTYPLIVNGQTISTRTWYESVNPSAPDEVVGQIANARLADVDASVQAARTAFGLWRLTRALDRADLLRKVADRLEMRRFELAATMIVEVGKPWREADADVTEAVDHWRYYAEQIERIESRPRLRNVPGEDNMLTYSPKGVCAVISPYAFPLAILSGMTSAALAAGNTVVMKPARHASVTAAKLVEIIHDAGLPAGVVNFIPGPGATIGPYLVEHGEVNILAFTGSHGVGAGVIRAGAIVRPGQAFIKKMIVEMGGQNAIIVDDDADLDSAVQAAIESAFAFAGQKCSSCSRLIVLDGVYDTLLPRLKEAVESVPIGPADQPSTVVGPLIDEESRVRVRDYIEAGRENATVLCEASLPPECARGYFVAPTVLADVRPNARIAQEEVFGPVLSVIRAADFGEALGIANNTRYALTGGVFSRSPEHIDRARREFAVGNLYINRKITGSQVDAQPFGGFKLSGMGVKAGSPDYLLHFMDARCITENTLRSGLVPREQHTGVS